jgi:putative ABC transport system permease protein
MYKSYFLVALRNLRRNKAFSAINILGLALGMTCCFLILLFVRQEFSYDHFQQKFDRIYRVTYNPAFAGTSKSLPFLSTAVSPLLKSNFPEIEESARLFQKTATIERDNKKFEESRFFFVDSTLPDIFTFKFLEGNPKTALTNTFSVVLSEKTAFKYFGHSPALGKNILLDGKYPLLVSGVVADFPDNSHIHLDLMTNYETMFATLPQEGRENLPGNWVISHSLTYVLLKPFQDPEKVNAGFPSFLLAYAPKEFAKSIKYRLQPMKDIRLHSDLEAEVEPVGSITFVYIFLGIAVITLLIAGINFVNLATARSLRRAREAGMRKVLGAEKRQLIGQFLGESLLLSFLAFIVALTLVALFLPVFNGLTQKNFNLRGILGDGPLLVVFTLIFVLAGLLAGLYPAFLMSGFKPAVVLKGDFAGGKARGGFVRQALLIFQFSASVALMIGTLVVFRQLQFLQTRDLGFQKDHVVIIPFKSRSLNTLFDQPNDSLYNRLQAFRETILRNPQVEAVTLSDTRPGQDGANRRGIMPEGFTVSDKIFAMDMKVDYNFIPTYGMKLVAGRNFSTLYGSDITQGFIVNETAVKRYHWGSPEEAIGKRMALVGRRSKITKEGTIIGVVKDFHAESLFQPIDVLVMDIDFRTLTTFSVKIHPENAPQTIAFLEKNWNAYFPEKDFVYDYLDQGINDQYENEQRLGKIIGYFAGLAVLISCLGLFGLIALAAQQRTREIGIRKVLGSSAARIVVLLSKDFLKLVVVSIVIASPVAWWVMDKWLADFAYRTPISWLLFLVAGIMAILIAMITISFQSLKAAFANPIRSLRSE